VPIPTTPLEVIPLPDKHASANKETVREMGFFVEIYQPMACAIGPRVLSQPNHPRMDSPDPISHVSSLPIFEFQNGEAFSYNRFSTGWDGIQQPPPNCSWAEREPVVLQISQSLKLPRVKGNYPKAQTSEVNETSEVF
jgi:hypothetical protein